MEVRDIQIDTREKDHAITKIIEEFDKQKIRYFSSGMYVGDYMSLDNARLCIDRKRNLGEICGNLCSDDHSRFRDELMRAQEHDIKLIILIEHGRNIKCLEDVIFWKNPNREDRVLVNGRWETIYNHKAPTGAKLYKTMCTVREKYGIEYEFCEKKDTGKRIIELLRGE